MRNALFPSLVVAVVAVSAACAAVIDTSVVQALAADPPTSQPATAVVAPKPTTAPVLVGGSISSEYAAPVAPVRPPPTLQGSPGGGIVQLGGGTDVGQGGGAPRGPSAASNVQAPATTRPIGPGAQKGS